MIRQPTVFAVDDDPLVLQLLEQVFAGASINVETFESATDFLQRYSPDNPGCILIDMMMPGMSGLELQETLIARNNHTPVIFLSGAAKVQFAVEALKAGAVDFLEKPIARDDLLQRVEQAMQLDMENRYKRLQQTNIELKIGLLTPRESEVMTWLVRGHSNKAIARTLGISSRTIEVHRRNIIDKMEARSIIELAEMVSELQK
jgi:FixJ family two-component response regulator